jgi:hypothetical protein
MLRVMAETSSATFLMTIWDDMMEMVLSRLPLSSLLAARFGKCRDGMDLVVEDKEVPPLTPSTHHGLPTSPLVEMVDYTTLSPARPWKHPWTS